MACPSETAWPTAMCPACATMCDDPRCQVTACVQQGKHCGNVTCQRAIAARIAFARAVVAEGQANATVATSGAAGAGAAAEADAAPMTPPTAQRASGRFSPRPVTPRQRVPFTPCGKHFSGTFERIADDLEVVASGGVAAGAMFGAITQIVAPASSSSGAASSGQNAPSCSACSTRRLASACLEEARERSLRARTVAAPATVGMDDYRIMWVKLTDAIVRNSPSATLRSIMMQLRGMPVIPGTQEERAHRCLVDLVGVLSERVRENIQDVAAFEAAMWATSNLVLGTSAPSAAAAVTFAEELRRAAMLTTGVGTLLTPANATAGTGLARMTGDERVRTLHCSHSGWRVHPGGGVRGDAL